MPTLHDPEMGRHIAVAQSADSIAGFISWKSGERPKHGEVYLLAVSPPLRGQGVGRRLCLHAIEEMKAVGVEVVEIGTGDDAFHAPARALYESFGFTKIPVAAYLMKI